MSFRPSIGQGREKALMKSGEVVDIRAKRNDALSHLILENVGESDEGVYIISSGQNPVDVTRVTLFVRGMEHPQILIQRYSNHIPLQICHFELSKQ